MTTTHRAIAVALLLALVCTVGGVAAWFRWGGAWWTQGPAAEEAVEHSPADADPPGHPTAAAPADDGTAAVKEFCSNCHVQPPPDCQPKWAWAGRIEVMYKWAKSLRPVPANRIPPIEVPIKYYTSHAPEELRLPDDAMGSPPSPIAFRRRPVVLEAIPGPPAVSNVQVVRLTDDGPTRLLICDMRHGLVVLWTPSRRDEPAAVIARIPHPSHAQVVDLDGDGLRDILVANLGDFWPVDTTKGSVVWLRNRGNGRFEPFVLLDGLGRVNDVEAADFDGDGDLDLVVAVFGNLTTGGIIFLENCTKDYAHPDFEASLLDNREGTMYVPVVDLNGDGHPDFIAVLAQEHERAIAFVNRGSGSFYQETIYAAPHCLWGSSGMRLIDLNGDGRMDVLYVNGDLVEDPPVPKPYHGLAWLENKGSFPFAFHRLANLPGAHTVLPADLDGDGKMDLVSSVFIPTFNPTAPIAKKLDTVIWLRQTSPGRFQRYSLETGIPFHPCGDIMDIDGDGDLDVVLGNFIMFSPRYNVPRSCLTVLENGLVSPDRRSPDQRSSP